MNNDKDNFDPKYNIYNIVLVPYSID